jgi:outer membrane lipoprotein-sorting protein
MMKSNKCILVAALMAMIAVSAGAQTVDEIFDKAIEAAGGRDAFKANNTMTVTGTVNITAMGMELPFTAYYMRPNKMRMESEYQGMTIIQATDGEKAWQINPMMGSTEASEIGGEQGAGFIKQADFDGPFMDYAEKGITPEFIGTETIDGEELHVVKVTYPDDFSMNAYFDVATGLARMLKMETSVGEVTMTFADYRKAGGLLIPFSMEQSAMGMVTTITYDEIKFNEPIDESIFDMPGEE